MRLLPLLTAAETRVAEEGHPGSLDELMERAGASVADLVLRAFPGRVTVVCGKGKNGGDGRICARVLGDGRAGALHQILERSLVRLFGPARLVRRQQRLQPHCSASMTTATAAASSRECVIESSIFPAPTLAAHFAVRPERNTPGFGRPRTSISFQVK